MILLYYRCRAEKDILKEKIFSQFFLNECRLVEKISI